MKRILDILISLVGVVFLWPLFVIIAFAIKLDTAGTVFYKQVRVGINGKEFILLKFRTMPMEAESQTGPVWATDKDPRSTPIGAILRKTALDELPQFINVIRGDMSIVGPRPERPFFVTQFTTTVPKYCERHLVQSGITGWAQVNGLRGRCSINERTKYDIFYVENWSFGFDLKIILMTLLIIVKGK